MATRNDNQKSGLQLKSKGFVYYSNKYINYYHEDLSEQGIDYYEKAIALQEVLERVGCWDVDYIDWSTDKDHIKFTCEIGNEDRALETLEEFIEDL